MRRPSNKAVRWAVPAACFAAVVALATLPGALSSSGASVPDLPALTPVELIAKTQAADVEALSGTVELRNDLGLPDLSGLGGGSADSVTALLAGSHEARIAVSGEDHVRVALPEPLAETNWILSGDDLWSWDSESQRVVHVSLAGDERGHGDAHHDAVGASPADLAQRLLDAVTPSTEVSVRSPRYVAGRAVYELALVPKSGASTVGEAALSVDAETGLPLDVRITPAGASTPAFELGFTSISFEPPPASTFEFTPPDGSTVVEAADPSAVASPGTESYHRRHRGGDASRQAQPGAGPEPTVAVVGEAWESVAVVSGATLPPEVSKVFDAAPRVESGAAGGRLVSTRLVNAVLLDDGRIVAGAVGPDTLLAAAAASR